MKVFVVHDDKGTIGAGFTPAGGTGRNRGAAAGR